jgi:hypothetical protein
MSDLSCLGAKKRKDAADVPKQKTSKKDKVNSFRDEFMPPINFVDGGFQKGQKT